MKAHGIPSIGVPSARESPVTDGSMERRDDAPKTSRTHRDHQSHAYIYIYFHPCHLNNFGRLHSYHISPPHPLKPYAASTIAKKRGR